LHVPLTCSFNPGIKTIGRVDRNYDAN